MNVFQNTSGISEVYLQLAVCQIAPTEWQCCHSVPKYLGCIPQDITHKNVDMASSHVSPAHLSLSSPRFQISVC